MKNIKSMSACNGYLRGFDPPKDIIFIHYNLTKSFSNHSIQSLISQAFSYHHETFQIHNTYIKPAIMVVKSLAISLLLAASATALSVPPTVQTFYNNVKNGGCHAFAGGKNNLNDGHGHGGFGYC